MSGSSPAAAENGPGAVERLDSLVGRFEMRFLQGGRPVLEEFLAGLAPVARGAALLELAHIELELRLKAGEPATTGP
jgi:hypothetical protein